MSIINNNSNNGYGVSHKLLTTKESNAIYFTHGCLGNNNNNNTVDGVLQIHHGCSGVVTETTYPPYKLMMRPFSSCDGGVVVGSVSSSSSSSSSSTACNNSCNNYTGVNGGGAGGVGGAAFVRTLQQPFNIPIPSSAHYSLSPGGGGMMATGLSLGFPFTLAQRKELERQALIYKYMVSSVPVPDDLLFPLVNKAYADPYSQQYSFDGLRVRYSSNGDLEPGRCKRTDGKKWRCARDAAPGQKYCERHLHRGRPRSRKHVELVPSNAAAATTNTTNKKTRLVQPETQVPTSVSNPRKCDSGVNSSAFPGTICSQPYSATSLSFGSLASGSPYKEPREVNWLMMSETAAAEMQDHQWQHMLVSKTGSSTETSSLCNLNSPNFHHHSTEQLLSLSSSKYSINQMDNYNDCTLYLNSDTSLDKSNEEAPRGIIDAWSNGSSHRKLSLSSLTLSMGGSGMGDSESGPLTAESDRGSRSHTSWVSSSPGGPLAEVLGSSILNQNSCNVSNTSSPRGTNEEPSSPLTATVSSPSRVLQKTLASMSDSSGGSSPTLASSMAKPEITLQWFNPSSN